MLHAFPDERSEDPGSSTPEPRGSCSAACVYWIPACAGKAAGAYLGPLFHTKMLGAVLLTLIVITIRRIKAGRPAPLVPHMPKLALAASLAGLTTIALAVLTFS